MSDDFDAALREMAAHAARSQGDGRSLVTPALTARTRRRRRVHDTAVAGVSAAAIVGVILAGAAVAGPRPEPLFPAVHAPTQTSAPTTVPSPSPSPSTAPPEPVPATAPPALETLVITARGLGLLTLGSALPTAPSAGDVIRFDDDACAGTEWPAQWVAAYPVGSMANGAPGAPFNVGVDGGRVVRIEVSTAGPRTDGGIQVGSTLAEVRAAHPEMAIVVPGEAGIDVWGVQDGPNSLLVEVSSNAAQPGWWGDDEVGRVVAIVARTGAPDEPYAPAWGGDSCG